MINLRAVLKEGFARYFSCAFYLQRALLKSMRQAREHKHNPDSWVQDLDARDHLHNKQCEEQATPMAPSLDTHWDLREGDNACRDVDRSDTAAESRNVAAGGDDEAAIAVVVGDRSGHIHESHDEVQMMHLHYSTTTTMMEHHYSHHQVREQYAPSHRDTAKRTSSLHPRRDQCWRQTGAA